MSQYFYCIDGQSVVGPHTSSELKTLFQESIIDLNTPVCCPGDKEWRRLQDFQLTENTSNRQLEQEPSIEKVPSASSAHEIKEQTQKIDVDALKEAGNDKEPEPIEEKKVKRNTRHQFLRAIRKDLDLLWEAQRESILSRIKSEDLAQEYEMTRKQGREIVQRIEASTIEYWRRSGSIEDWVEVMVWKEADIQRKLRGTDNYAKFEDAKKWLTVAKLWDEAGCYCFKKEADYLYVGQASASLGQRLSQHEDSVHFANATHLRVIVPKHKTWVAKLERMLILQYQPLNNDRAGKSGANPVDDLLEFVRGEINELVYDYS